MPTVSLKISQEVSVRLGRAAARQRKSKSAVIREALEGALRSAGGRPSVRELMGATVGSVRSRVSDLGHNPVHLKGFGRR